MPNPVEILKKSIMDIDIYFLIGQELLSTIRKSYSAGIGSIVAKNKKRLKFDDRDLFKVDYSVEDIHALNNFKVEAFTVAGVGSYELEERLKELALEIKRDKNDLAEFEKRAQELISEYTTDVPAAGYLRNNLTTAYASAFNAGQWNRLRDPAALEIYTAYQYKTRNDSKVRPEHAELHDKIYKNDDSILNYIYPPNGWNCRCFIIPLMDDELGGQKVERRKGESQIQKFLKKSNIPKEFQRNAGNDKSIWDKWLNTKLTGKKRAEINKRLKDYAEGKDTELALSVKRSDLPKKSNSAPVIDNAVADVMNVKVIINTTGGDKTARELVKNPHEVWGRTFRKDGVLHSVQYYIKFTKEGTLVGTVKDGVLDGVIQTTHSNAGTYRAGVLIYKNFN